MKSIIIRVLRSFLFLYRISLIKTFYVNFRFLPLKKAVTMPILIGNYLNVSKLFGGVIISDNEYFGMIRLGFRDMPIQDAKRRRMIIECSKNSNIVFKGSAWIGSGTRIQVRKGATLEFGDNFYLSLESLIICHSGITFRDNCTVGWDTTICDTDYHTIVNLDTKESSPITSTITIGTHCWICNGCSIMKGTYLPDDCVVASKSMCNKRYIGAEHSLLAGVPAKIKKMNVTHIR